MIHVCSRNQRGGGSENRKDYKKQINTANEVINDKSPFDHPKILSELLSACIIST
jgi:hypothetical protein